MLSRLFDYSVRFIYIKTISNKNLTAYCSQRQWASGVAVAQAAWMPW